MALIVEDGTGLEDAQSYVSLTDATTRMDLLGLTGTLTESALYIAFQYVNAKCYEGTPTNPLQSGAFPRSSLWINGAKYPSDKIPQDVIDAQIIVATQSLTMSLWGTDNGRSIKRNKVDVIEQEFFEGATSGQTISVERADSLLYRYTCGNGINGSMLIKPLTVV